MKIPDHGTPKDRIYELLQEYRANDNDWRSGRTWGYIYDPGREAEEVGKQAYMMFLSENALDPTVERRTGRVRTSDGKGRHTTTSSTIYAIGEDARVIDTPGIRAFGLWGVDRASLGALFPELAELAGGCRFSDCSHLHEPDCAVRAALERGELPAERYDAYRRIHATLEE